MQEAKDPEVLRLVQTIYLRARHGFLPLDDLLDHLQAAIAKLTRSNLHRCLKHHGISRVPEEIRPKKKHGKFRSYEIGYTT